MNHKANEYTNDMLNEIRKNKEKVNIYLVNGIKLHGQVLAFDRETIILSNSMNSDKVSMITRSNITTTEPSFKTFEDVKNKDFNNQIGNNYV